MTLLLVWSGKSDEKKNKRNGKININFNSMWPFCSEMLFSACVLVSGIYLLYLICSQFKQKMNKTNKSPLALPFFLFFLIFDEVSGQWQISQNCNTNNKHVHAITTILSTRTSSFQFSWIVNSHRLYSPSISMLLSYFFFSSLLFSFAYSGHISQSTIPKNIVCHTILQWCVFFLSLIRIWYLRFLRLYSFESIIML